MINGKVKEIAWNKYTSPNFEVSKIKSNRWSSCGSPIISLITGVDPMYVERCCPNSKRGWSTRALTGYLTKKHYTVIQVTKNSVNNVYWQHYPLNPNHLLVINSSVDLKEASWFLLHKEQLWHNDYRQKFFNSLFFLNKPTQDVLLVWHPKWAPKFSKGTYAN